MKRSILQQILVDRRAQRAAVLATYLSTGDQVVIHPWSDERPSDVDEWLWNAARTAAERDACRVVERPEGHVFLNAFNPRLRMVIVGAVHIAQALVPMAQIAGFDVVVVDPRRGFATEARFPNVALNLEWPDKALEALAPNRRTAVVVVSHDRKLDDPALSAALRSDAIYIGALGGAKTQTARRERLRQKGFGEADLIRINGPIGLAIGARSPAEIAVAILAQVVQTVRLH